MFEAGKYYVCTKSSIIDGFLPTSVQKKNDIPNEVNVFLNTVFNNKAKQYSKRYNMYNGNTYELGIFFENRIYYCHANGSLCDNNNNLIRFSDNSNAGYGYEFKEIGIDMSSIKQIVTKLNKHNLMSVSINPHMFLCGTVQYLCEFNMGYCSAQSFDSDPKRALYIASKAVKERIATEGKTYKALMGIF